MKLLEGMVIAVEHAEYAEYAGEYALRLRFSDGNESTINFEPFLRRSSNPMIQEFLDSKRFAEFRIKDGDLIWGDYELCFPIADLYENTI